MESNRTKKQTLLFSSPNNQTTKQLPSHPSETPLFSLNASKQCICKSRESKPNPLSRRKAKVLHTPEFTRRRTEPAFESGGRTSWIDVFCRNLFSFIEKLVSCLLQFIFNWLLYSSIQNSHTNKRAKENNPRPRPRQIALSFSFFKPFTYVFPIPVRFPPPPSLTHSCSSITPPPFFARPNTILARPLPFVLSPLLLNSP